MRRGLRRPYGSVRPKGLFGMSAHDRHVCKHPPTWVAGWFSHSAEHARALHDLAERATHEGWPVNEASFRRYEREREWIDDRYLRS